MNLVQPLIINLLTHVLWVGGGVIIALIGRHYRTVYPNKKLWGLNISSKVIICIATIQTNADKYIRPATGIGQLKALSYIVTSLNKAYKRVDYKNIMSSEEELNRRIEDDIIVLGGPKNNRITESFFKEFDSLNVALQELDGSIYWQQTNSIYRGVIKGDKVVGDYALIIKMDNMFSSSSDNKSKFILFSGCHTYGTIAAARYFCECLNKEKSIDSSKNFVLLISCNVADGYPVKMELVDKVYLN